MEDVVMEHAKFYIYASQMLCFFEREEEIVVVYLDTNDAITKSDS